MVDKIIVNPENVRGVGNIISPKSLSDFILKKSSLNSDVESIDGIDTNVFILNYNDLEPSIVNVILENPVSEELYIGDTIRLSSKAVTEDNIGVSGVTIQLYVDDTLVSEKVSNYEGVAYFDYTISKTSTDFKVKYEELISNIVTVSAVRRDTTINIEE